MIVGFAPGGGVDVLARVVAQELNDYAGIQMVIENRPGAGSNIAAKAKDKPPSFGFGGSSSRIIAEYVLKVMAKTEATAVPFQSGAPALNVLLGNHVDIIAAPIAELVPQVR